MFRRALSLMLLILVVSGCNTGQSITQIQGDSAVQPVRQVAAPDSSTIAKAAFAQPAAKEQPAADLPEANQPPSAPASQPVENEPAAAEAPDNTPVAPQPVAKEVPGSLGPDQFPAGVSPLSGLPVPEPENLALAPALVSVTNFPTTARPQAGLSFSPFVYEMYIGEGMTRFLAVFYGEYPEKGENSAISLADDRIGPVRSGRLPYESLRQLYNGFLVMSSASSVVLPSLGGYTNVFGSDTDDINSALIPATKLKEIASKNPKRLQVTALSGLRFDRDAPQQGQPGKMIWIPYNFLNQVIWRYDSSSGAYLRYQDDADGKTFIQATDRLNNKPLTYENVVILFAQHNAKRETLIDINLMYVDRMPALLFRDGKMYKVYWTTANGDYEKKTGLVRPIRFIDAKGNPFPLKPGQTWVEIVQDHTPYNETVDSEVYFDLKNKVDPGSGNWAIHFFPTVPER